MMASKVIAILSWSRYA